MPPRLAMIVGTRGLRQFRAFTLPAMIAENVKGSAYDVEVSGFGSGGLGGRSLGGDARMVDAGSRRAEPSDNRTGAVASTESTAGFLGNSCRMTGTMTLLSDFEMS